MLAIIVQIKNPKALVFVGCLVVAALLTNLYATKAQRERCMNWYEEYLQPNSSITKEFRNKDNPDRQVCEKLGMYF